MVGMDIKKMFFDRKVVRSAVDRATRQVFSKFGSHVRRRARNSMRPAPKKSPHAVSRPGRPPRSHTGLLKRLIYFGYERQRRSVVIGPVRLNRKVGDAPEALEYGGTSTVVASLRGKRKKRRVKIAARPYMGPAFKQEKPKLAAMWRDSIR